MKNKKKIMKLPTRDMPVAPEPSEDDRKPTGFLDLSAELRNAVYKLTLIRSSRIPVSTLRVPLDQSSEQDEGPWSPNLLATCKTIHSEATAVLYGSHYFVVTSQAKDKPYHTWMDTIGSSVKHLRRVEIAGAISPRTFAAMMTSLECAASLQTLRVRVTLGKQQYAEISYRHSTMANALYWLVLKLHQDRKGTDRSNVLDVLDLGTAFEHLGGLAYGDMRPVKGILEKRLIAFDAPSRRRVKAKT